MKKAHYRKYDLIFTEGSPGDCAYMIDKGRILIISGKNIHGKHKVLAVLSTNAIFGEMALIDEDVRTATAFALEDCQFSHHPKDASLFNGERTFDTRFSAGGFVATITPNHKIIEG